ncbi:MAG: YeeE/YedE family protein [Phycisphaerae bacterium]|nr:YeeE/YedE family protein [Phycisphaerae bacterium]
MDTRTQRADGSSLGVVEKAKAPRTLTRPDDRDGVRQAPGRQGTPAEVRGSPGPATERPVRSRARRLTSPLFMVGYFAVLNVIMYLTIHKFWIGGSSFLPMVGKLGEGNKFLFAFLVNIGVIVGAFVGAYSSGEFHLRLPKKRDLVKAMIGGTLIGMGVTVAPGTCTTAFVTGMPMLSVSSFLSAAGIFIGAHIVYSQTLGRR